LEKDIKKKIGISTMNPCCRTPTKTLLIYGFSSIKFSYSTMMSILFVKKKQ